MDVALQKLPRGVDALVRTYDEAMERIKAQEFEKCAVATRVMSWISFVQRPLTIDELRDSLAVYRGGEESALSSLRG